MLISMVSCLDLTCVALLRKVLLLGESFSNLGRLKIVCLSFAEGKCVGSEMTSARGYDEYGWCAVGTVLIPYDG
jgi:hypothetical protein